jgi:hypothetical protein
MRRAECLAMLAVVIGMASSAQARYVNGSVSLLPIEWEFASVASAAYYDDLNAIDYSAVLSGTHSVSGPSVYEASVYGYGQYAYTLEGPVEAGACYGTALHVIGDPPGPLNTREGTWTGTTRCAPPPPGGSGCGSTAVCEQSESCPLILDLNNDGIHTTGLDDPVHFWIDLQGRTEATAWTDPATEEAFLWIDFDRDRVAQVTELFGSRMRAPNGDYHAHGFDALMKFDRVEFGGDRDGQITHRDAVWPHLRLWVDRNHDAISQEREISGLSSHRIVALNLAHVEGETYDDHGNELYLSGSYLIRAHGQSTEVRTMADVEFQYVAN